MKETGLNYRITSNNVRTEMRIRRVDQTGFCLIVIRSPTSSTHQLPPQPKSRNTQNKRRNELTKRQGDTLRLRSNPYMTL